MNGKCYYSEGVNPTLTCNKGEGGKIAIPVITPARANKRQNGRRFKEDGEAAFTLTSQDIHGVAVEVEPLQINSITGYDTTLKSGGGCHGNRQNTNGKRLQRTWRAEDDNGDVMFLIDKGIKPQEREIANCIEARENRGLSKREQEGTLICIKV